MLVLSRKVNQDIIIDNQIRVRVIETRGGKVRLGIVAPPEISVVRDNVVTNSPLRSVLDCRANVSLG